MAEINNRNSITHLADDSTFFVLQLLPIDSILSFAFTCKRFEAIASSEILWEIIYRRDYGNSSVEGILASSERKVSWKKLYQLVFHLDSASCLRLSGKDGIIPEGRVSHTLNIISEFLVIFGGGCIGRSLYDTWMVYIGNEVRSILRWQKTNSGICSGQCLGQTCTVIGDALVLFGGIDENGILQNDTWIGHVMHDEALEIKISWRLLDVGPIVPPPRGFHSGCCVGDKRMVIHGGSGQDGLTLNDTWLLELSDGARSATWHEIITHPSPLTRSCHTLTWIGGTHMIVFGGTRTGKDVLNDIWLLDIGNEYPEWVEINYDLCNVPDGVPLPRSGHSATLVIGDRVLIYGGYKMDDFWVLDPSAIPTFKMQSQTLNLKRSSGKLWKRLTVEGHRPGCRTFHRACADRSGHRVYIFGGEMQPAELSRQQKINGELYLVELVLQI